MRACVCGCVCVCMLVEIRCAATSRRLTSAVAEDQAQYVCNKSINKKIYCAV